jgi:hypothetical protein
MPAQGLTNRLLNVPVRWMGAGLGVLALGIAGMFHGLNPVTKPGTPQVKVGVVNAGQPWNITVADARVLTDLAPLIPKETNERLFVVEATVEITAPEARDDLNQALQLQQVLGLQSDQPAHVVLIKDATEIGYLNPGMPEKLAFIWNQSTDVPVPTNADVQIVGMTYREDSLSHTATAKGTMIWTDPAVRADVVVPVLDKRK